MGIKRIVSEKQLTELATSMAAKLTPGTVLTLSGDLGAGKTTFVRAFLRAKGVTGPVKSPTFTLVEPYENLNPPVYHFDLYRLDNPEELEAIGIRDYADKNNILLIEWPEKGQGFIPKVDITIELNIKNDAREITIQGLDNA